jgi:hypothetical protein
MLETKLAAGDNLNPYVVWYNGKNRIHEGYAADGAARFIWRTPERTGFHILKVEAFPFKPLDGGLRPPAGKIKELSLPVAAKNEDASFGGIPAGLEAASSEKVFISTRRYQLFANLEDSQNSILAGNVLTAVNHTPEWLPRGNIYGLAVGPDRFFSIPGPLFTPSSPDAAEGHLLFRFVPLADGTIFSGSFKLKPGLARKDSVEPKEWFETLDMDLTYAGGVVSLTYSAGSAAGEKTAFLFSGQTENVVTVVISFEVRENTLRLSLGLNVPAEFLPDEGIPLPGPLTGGGTFLLGASLGEAGAGGGTDTSSDQPSGTGTGDPAVPAETGDPVSTVEAAVQTDTAEISDPASPAETTAAAGDHQANPVRVTETKPASPVIILDEIAFLIVPNTSFNKVTQTIAAVPDSSGGMTEAAAEDISAEAMAEDDTRAPESSGKTAGDLEITGSSLPPNIADKAGDVPSLTE